MAVINSTQKRLTYFLDGTKYEVRNDTDGSCRVVSSTTFGVFREEGGEWTKLENSEGKDILDRIAGMEGYDGSGDSSFSTYIGRLLTYVENKYQNGRVAVTNYELAQSEQAKADYEKQVELAVFQAKVQGQTL